MKKGADYLFSLKGNQRILHDAVKEYWDMLNFNRPAAEASYIKFRTTATYEEKHGRQETRDNAVSDAMEQCQSIGVVESARDAGEGKPGSGISFPACALMRNCSPARSGLTGG